MKLMQMPELRSAIVPILLAMAATAATRTVWDGVYSKRQSGRGLTAYNSRCARCHGEALLGGENSPALVEQDFLEKWNGRSVGSLVELIRTTMPSDGPGRLSRQQCTDMVAYLLSANNFPAGDNELAAEPDAQNDILFQAKK
jgi:S-disulfanyl-L-cysteine oxidoreductase SoxD